jgi:hypothetical protein
MNWLTQLLDVPFVLLLATSRQRADLEIAGKPAFASQTGEEICIGLVLDVEPEAFGRWAHTACLMLAAVADTTTAHDALAITDETPVLWRRYGNADEVAASSVQLLTARLEAHISLARYLRAIAGNRSRRVLPPARQLV